MRAVRPEPVAGLQRARPRESAPAYSWRTGRARAPQGASDGGDPQRARPASGAPNVSRGQQEARGARQRVALCFGSRGGRARPVPIEELEPGARVPRHFLELCEWFRDCSQASGASQRVQRASAPRPSIGLRCGWPCTAWPTARPQPGSCFAEFDRCAPASLLGFTPLPVRCAFGPASHESQCAARRAWPAGALRDGVDSLCADRRRCAPWERGVSGSGGARACSRERAGARATPTYLIHCARTCCSQRGSVRFAHAVLPIWASLRACFAPARRSVGGAAGRARLAPGILGRRARLGRLPG